jgi:hypothetical protein
MVNDTEYSSAGESNRGYQKIIVRDSDNPKESKSEEKPYEGVKTNRSNNTGYKGSKLQRIMRSPITLASAVILGGVLAYNSSRIYNSLSTLPKQTYSPQKRELSEKVSSPIIPGQSSPKKTDSNGKQKLYYEPSNNPISIMIYATAVHPFLKMADESSKAINETLGEAKERGLERKAEEKGKNGEKEGLFESFIKNTLPESYSTYKENKENK